MSQSGLTSALAVTERSGVIDSDELSKEEIVVTKLKGDWKVVSSKLTQIENILAVKEVCDPAAYYDRVIRETKEFIGKRSGMFSEIQPGEERHPLTQRLIVLFENSAKELTTDVLGSQTGGAGGEDQQLALAGQPASQLEGDLHPVIYKPSTRHDVSTSEKCIACIMILFQIGLVFLLMWVLSGPLKGGIRIMDLSTKAVEYADRAVTEIGSTLPTCTQEQLNDPLLDHRADGVYTYKTPDQTVAGFFTTTTIPGGKIVEQCMERSTIGSFFSQGAGAVSDTVSIVKVVTGGALGVCSCGMATVIIVKVLDYIQRYGSSIVCQILALTALMNNRIDFNGFRLGMERERERNRRDFEELQREFDRDRIPMLPATQPPAASHHSTHHPDSQQATQGIEDRQPPASQASASSDKDPDAFVTFPRSIDPDVARAKSNQLRRNASLGSQEASPGESPPLGKMTGGSYTKSKSRRKYKRKKTNQIRKKTKRKRRRRRRTSRK